jgi:hypothetical protein
MWCTIINGALLVFSAIMFILASDLAYNVHGKLFPMPRETFNVVIYSFLGVFKIFWLVFNVVPYVALLIVQKK